MASMALLVGSFPGKGVLSSYSASSVTIGGGIVGVAKAEGPAPGVMNPGGLMSRAVKLRGLRPIGVEAGSAEGAAVGVLVTRGDVAGETMTDGAVAGGIVTVGAGPLGLVTTGELLGAEDPLWLVSPLEPLELS